MKAAIDEAEDAVELPILLERMRNERSWAVRIVSDFGDGDDKRRMILLEADLDQAADAGDLGRLRRSLEETVSHATIVIARRPSFWVQRLDWLEENRGQMREPGQVDLLLTQGRRAIHRGHIDALKAACSRLQSLLPKEQRNTVRSSVGHTISA